VATLEAWDGVVPQHQFPYEVCSFLSISASEQKLSPEDYFCGLWNHEKF
jgi:hypothetical protein